MLEEIRVRLVGELDRTLARARQGAEMIVAEPVLTVSGDPADDAASDASVLLGEREIGFAHRSRLLVRARHLADALERMQRGDYGICEECGRRIAPRRLRAMPEASTCVPCQDRLERLGCRLREPVGATRLLDTEEDG